MPTNHPVTVTASLKLTKIHTSRALTKHFSDSLVLHGVDKKNAHKTLASSLVLQGQRYGLVKIKKKLHPSLSLSSTLHRPSNRAQRITSSLVLKSRVHRGLHSTRRVPLSLSTELRRNQQTTKSTHLVLTGSSKTHVGKRLRPSLVFQTHYKRDLTVHKRVPLALTVKSRLSHAKKYVLSLSFVPTVTTSGHHRFRTFVSGLSLTGVMKKAPAKMLRAVFTLDPDLDMSLGGHGYPASEDQEFEIQDAADFSYPDEFPHPLEYFMTFTTRLSLTATVEEAEVLLMTSGVHSGL